MAAFIRLDPDRLDIAPDKVVLSPEEVSLRMTAHEALNDAHTRALEIKADAETAFEVEKERGYAEGREKADAELSEQLLTMVTRSVDYLGTAEAEVAKTVALCLRKILGEAPEEEIVLKAARNALSLVANETRITLSVSPQVSDSVKNRVAEILRDNDTIDYLEVIADPSMQRGGCKLETDLGVVDASIDLQIDALERVLAERARTKP